MTDTLAVIAGKLSARAIRASGAGLGSNLPGRLSRAISPAVLGNLSRQCRRGVLAVSGTNGKSTTTGFVSSILSLAGYKTAHNRQGANLVTGITASLVDAADWRGRLDVDYCLFEIDEAALPVVAQEVPISTILVTNLFRDQLDRFGELDTTASLIGKGIACNQSTAVLNADDPNVAQLAPDSRRVFFGIESIADGNETGANDDDTGHGQPAAGVQELAYCPDCGSEYAYSRSFYGQLGHYQCKSCGKQRPSPDVSASDVRVHATGSSFALSFAGETFAVDLPLPGLFNVYNALAAATLGFSLGIAGGIIVSGLAGYTTLFGRSERLTMRGHSVLIQLIKNPAGASQALRAAANDREGRLLIAINDNLADGRDVSWLWDAEFERLSGHEKNIVVSGQRCFDMAVRLKYAGIPESNIQVIQPLDQALNAALDSTEPNETLWVLPTYTCLLDLQKIARGLGHALSGT